MKMKCENDFVVDDSVDGDSIIKIKLSGENSVANLFGHNGNYDPENLDDIESRQLINWLMSDFSWADQFKEAINDSGYLVQNIQDKLNGRDLKILSNHARFMLGFNKSCPGKIQALLIELDLDDDFSIITKFVQS